MKEMKTANIIVCALKIQDKGVRRHLDPSFRAFRVDLSIYYLAIINI